MGRIAEETSKGLKWGVIQKCTLQPVQFIYGIILARLISPDEMGILGLTGIFFAFASQLQNCGFGAALIRKQERTDADICTVFWFNVGMSAILSTCLFISAPWFAWFYEQPALLNLTRVSAILMFLGSTSSVHWTLYSARRDFKTPAIVGIICTLLPMPFTIWAAYSGWSYWSIMVQSVISSLLSLAIIWIISPWKPKFIWSNKSFREFFGFGSKLMLSSLVWTAYSESRTFIIGKFYSPAQLAFFTRAFSTCQAPMSVVQGMLGSVTYPILATLQEDKSRLIEVYRRYIRLSALVVEWGMITMASNSHSYISALYGSNWVQAATYCQLLCIGIMFNPLSNINSNLYNVLGRSDMTLRKEIILRACGFPIIILGAFWSVLGICLATISIAILSVVVSVIITSRISELQAKQQLTDFIPYLIMALVANAPSLTLNFLHLNPFLTLFCGVSSSLAIYIVLLVIRRDQEGAFLLHYMMGSKIGQTIITRIKRT